MRIHETGENYLETILILERQLGQVRAIDIANALGYAKPTVSVAMRDLRAEGYSNIDENGYISLTTQGLEVAQRMYERHEILARFLAHLGVDEKTAYEDACKIEHDISACSFEKIKEHYYTFLCANE